MCIYSIESPCFSPKFCITVVSNCSRVLQSFHARQIEDKSYAKFWNKQGAFMIFVKNGEY